MTFKTIRRFFKYHLYYYTLEVRNFLFAERKVDDCKRIPIIINNFNHYTYLRDMIEALEKRGYRNLYVIDNHSTYPPLLEYYKTLPYKVFLLEENLGFRAFELSGICKQFRNRFFVYTDSDLLFPDACPDDFLERFYRVLTTRPYTAKVGNALRIDDLPDCYAQKQKVIDWESQYWQHPLGNDLYLAPIDTTFCLHKPNTHIGHHYTGERIRVAGPCTLVHRPWYIDSEHLTDEERYYADSVNRANTFWTEPKKD